ncbi:MULTISPECIES: NUDIX hydrolase [unclassified Janibacter]|uniref:NUDIX hydrolase n=1 Tax=unclassified Janibacter TaxID=2649294 RepID=UPI003D0661BD
MAEAPDRIVAAAGTLPWRRRRGRLEVALVHRPRYDDWAWAKGKLDQGEIYPVAAVRETDEETGLVVRLGRPLPTATYRVVGNGLKEVRYWAAEVVGGHGRLENEIDEVLWLDTDAASQRLTYDRDRDQLRALVAADEDSALTTWPLALVRHAKATPRAAWDEDDQLRPLDRRGRDQAKDLVPLLASYGLTRLVSSPSTRCADTLEPYAAAVGTTIRLKPGLSEEGFESDPGRAIHHLTRLLERGTASALCSHGPVLPELVRVLGERVDDRRDEGKVAAAVVQGVMDEGMTKGEVLVVHVVGTGPDARIVSAERHHPRDTA